MIMIDDYLKIVTDEEVKDFLAINFGEYFKFTKKEQNLRRVIKSLSIFLATPAELNKYVPSTSSDNCVHHYNAAILNLFDPELRVINTKPVIKIKLKKLLNELKSSKFRHY